MSLDLDLTFPIRDVPSADLMRLKATCLWNAGIIDAGERKLVQQRAERFLRRAKAVAALWPSTSRGTARSSSRAWPANSTAVPADSYQLPLLVCAPHRWLNRRNGG
jgi:hypothetical protein